MPIYEYKCSSCGFQKEYLQKVSDPRLTDCPECGKATFLKMLTAAGFQLKGGGWYVTDFRDGGSKPAAATTPAASPSGDGAKASTESKSDSKSDSGGESKSTSTTPAATPAPAAAAPAASSPGSSSGS